MSFRPAQEKGRPVTIKDEGLTLANNVASIDLVGSGVNATAIGQDVTEEIIGDITSSVSKTHSQLQTMVAGSLLIPGQTYLISDKNIIIRAATTNSFETSGSYKYTYGKKAWGKISISSGTGNISSLKVNGVEILGSTITYATNTTGYGSRATHSFNVNTSAFAFRNNIVAAINAYQSNYRAYNNYGMIIIESATTGTAKNGYNITGTTSGAVNLSNAVALSGGTADLTTPKIYDVIYDFTNDKILELYDPEFNNRIGQTLAFQATNGNSILEFCWNDSKVHDNHFFEKIIYKNFLDSTSSIHDCNGEVGAHGNNYLVNSTISNGESFAAEIVGNYFVNSQYIGNVTYLGGYRTTGDLTNSKFSYNYVNTGLIRSNEWLAGTWILHNTISSSQLVSNFFTSYGNIIGCSFSSTFFEGIWGDIRLCFANTSFNSSLFYASQFYDDCYFGHTTFNNCFFTSNIFTGCDFYGDVTPNIFSNILWQKEYSNATYYVGAAMNGKDAGGTGTQNSGLQLCNKFMGANEVSVGARFVFDGSGGLGNMDDKIELGQVRSRTLFNKLSVFTSGYTQATGSVNRFDDDNRGGVDVEYSGLQLVENQIIIISGTSSYDGTYTITDVTTSTFKLNVAYVGNDNGSYTETTSIKIGLFNSALTAEDDDCILAETRLDQLTNMDSVPSNVPFYATNNDPAKIVLTVTNGPMRGDNILQFMFKGTWVQGVSSATSANTFYSDGVWKRNSANGYIELYRPTDTVLVGSLTASKVVFTDAGKVLSSTGPGASTDFIKGDGSLDSSTYLTTSSASSTYIPYTGSSTNIDFNAKSLKNFFISKTSDTTAKFTFDVGSLSTGTTRTFTVPDRSFTFDNITTSTTSNGTGFVKANGSVISFDNSTYLTTSSASSTYVPYTGATSALNLGANNFTVDTSAFFVDRLNKTIGIGSNTKLNALTVTPRASFVATGTTTANASTTITGSGTLFLSEIGIGDRISLSSASSTYAYVTAIASDTSLTVSTALGNGTSQTINVLKAIFRLNDSTGTQKFLLDDQGNIITSSAFYPGLGNSSFSFGNGLNGTNGITLVTNLNTQWKSTNSNGYFGFSTKPNTRTGINDMFLDNAGNFSIGSGTSGVSSSSLFLVTQTTVGYGTVSTPGSSTTLTGVGTQFTNTFKVGDTITVNGESVRTIASITSDTVLDVTSAFSATPRSAVTYTLTGGDRFAVKGNGRVGIGTITPSALLHLAAGTATAGTAPLKFTSGTLLTTPEAGAIEFNTDSYYGTITTGGARKTFAFLESPTFTGTLTAPSIVSTTIIRLKGYTVATLPAGTVGDTAYVTDALAPTFLATVVGGGAVTTPVFYNGTNWIVY